MAKIEGRPTVKLEVSICLTEEEAGALDAILGYDADVFLRVFYEQIGRAYLEPYEAGVRALFSNRGILSGLIRKAKDARAVFGQK